MKLRRLCFWTGYVLRHRTALIAGFLDSLMDRFGRRSSFEGIKIVAPPGSKGEAEPPFIHDTIAALQLIQSEDPRRFKRLQREVAVVTDGPNLSFGGYSRPGRRCYIDFARNSAKWREQYPEWSQWVYATTLVHEATHGAIYSRHVHYTRKTRVRIERLCCTEARRFAARADREDRQWSDALVPPFDETQWYEDWHNSPWQKARKLFARYREVSATAKSKKRP